MTRDGDGERDAGLVADMIALAAVAADIVADGKPAFIASRRSYLAAKMIVIDTATAASRLSDGYVSQHPDVPWRQIAGMRNRLAHDYALVDVEIVWATLRDALPSLAERLREL